ncbi:hypothetical protein GUITHDRAFT_133112 [Guillardia theta CCMP2712]|uniref:Uncharacterized protein n=1 Tax=Guillardia theta (strain CCMP2712) TaxID=905079 RepID=L1JYF3_GUITC|nr:hypothetical protein GUITHDRAFT_133112 [Guillardia theta CCMP2712]EKX53387.1 hypothetical protein GUITHDRAFT_133112 [Guillardia theta CCMP2712]|eukprot:XP_005840367.1 hypothetical protein GUITHDRAFT_133112 [Guillardia theta CCMP2712]
MGHRNRSLPGEDVTATRDEQYIIAKTEFSSDQVRGEENEAAIPSGTSAAGAGAAEEGGEELEELDEGTTASLDGERERGGTRGGTLAQAEGAGNGETEDASRSEATSFEVEDMRHDGSKSKDSEHGRERRLSNEGANLNEESESFTTTRKKSVGSKSMLSIEVEFKNIIYELQACNEQLASINASLSTQIDQLAPSPSNDADLSHMSNDKVEDSEVQDSQNASENRDKVLHPQNVLRCLDVKELWWSPAEISKLVESIQWTLRKGDQHFSEIVERYLDRKSDTIGMEEFFKCLNDPPLLLDVNLYKIRLLWCMLVGTSEVKDEESAKD